MPGHLAPPRHDARHHVADPVADVHGVVADALVVAGDQGQLHRGLHVEVLGPAHLQQVPHEHPVEAVEPVVDVVEGAGQTGVVLGVGVHREPDEPDRLLAHLRYEAPQLGGQLRGEHPPGALADVAGQTAGPLQFRGDPHGGQDLAEVAGHGLLQGQQALALLLDLDSGNVDVVVIVDDLLGLSQVVPQQGVGGSGDGVVGSGRRAAR